MYQNLHCHTKIVDGELGHQEILDLCKQLDISVVAFTDHDALPNEQVIKILQKNRNHAVKWIIGCELSSGYPKEIGGPASDFHIVGLFINPFDKNLVEHCQKSKQARIERMEKMVKNLKSLDFEISKRDCLKESSGESITRSQIVAVLVKKEKNLRIIEELKQKMAKESQHSPLLRQKYDEMIKKGAGQVPYSLFLAPGAFFPDIYVEYLYWKSMDENVKLIRGAGGVAILAHWWTSKKIVNEKIIEKLFQQKRLDGAETVFGVFESDGFNTELREKIEKDMEIMEGLTKKYNMLQSGGGDSHTKKDFEMFVKQKWLAEKTIGLVEKMLELRDLNLKFSSLKI